MVSRASAPVTCRLAVEVAADGAPIAPVKAGHREPPRRDAGGRAGPSPSAWSATRSTVAFAPDPRARSHEGDAGAVAHFDLTVNPGERCPRHGDDPGRARVGIGVRRRPGLGRRLLAERAGRGRRPAPGSSLRCRSGRPAAPAAERPATTPDDVFAAAGTPWYLTLFGRDSLWAARMMLPFGTDLAAGTLRTLARRQGRATTPTTAEAARQDPPRGAPHGIADPGERPRAPAGLLRHRRRHRRCGSACSHEAWRWGLPLDDGARRCCPTSTRPLGWLDRAADSRTATASSTTSTPPARAWPTRAGRTPATRCAWRDGRVADAPIALVETQAYAVRGAARRRRTCSTALGEPGADGCARAPPTLATGCASAFWVGRPPRAATSPWRSTATGDPVDGLGCNMGHVLGTGALSTGESARGRAATVTGPELLGHLRGAHARQPQRRLQPDRLPHRARSGPTTPRSSPSASPARAHREEAATVARALRRRRRGLRLPLARAVLGASRCSGRPSPYPASCRPQAWSAASAGALVTVALGLRPRWPTGGLRVEPPRHGPFGAVRVEGLRFRGHAFSVEAGPDGAGPGHRAAARVRGVRGGALRLGRIFRKGLSPSWVCSSPSTAPTTSRRSRRPAARPSPRRSATSSSSRSRKTGGHLGPNLGVVELTIAIHRVFDSPRDTVVFDTGHQSYVHKLLTGRHDFTGLRTQGGLSGYPSRAESEHDVVENSHASTSLSWAARHRRRRGVVQRRARPAHRRGHRRRRPHRRHGLGGAQQHRRRARPAARHRRQRQRALLRPDQRRPGRPPRDAAHDPRLRALPRLGQAHPARAPRSSAARCTRRCTA